MVRRRCPGLLVLVAALAPMVAALSMDVDLSKLLHDQGLGSAEPKLLEHGVSNLHTLQVLDDNNINGLGMLPMEAKLFKLKHKQLIEDLVNIKGKSPLRPTEADEEKRKRKKEEFVQDLTLFLGLALSGVAVLIVYIFWFQPQKAGKFD
jgi:hypothetical protein